jgi:DNA polymerase I-like protein with 3'-5' exonuclease and polymerase domains
MISVFDVETSFQLNDEGKKDPSAKNPDNFLVSLGINDEYIFFKHREFKGVPNRKVIQDILDKTTLLVGHNIKFDLLWLWEAGFKYDGRVCDTMLVEYIFNRGIKRSLTLKDCCAFRGVIQKSDLTEPYLKNNISFENIPIGIVEEYGRLDVKATRSLFDAQMSQLKKPQHKHLIKTIQNMCQFVVVLTKMEDNGIYIDRKALDEVEKDFQTEYDELRVKIDEEIYARMGDTKINPASPEQLSWLIYGVQVKNKKEWARIFNLGIDKVTKKQKRRPRFTIKQLKKIFDSQLEPVYKTKAEQCPVCKGRGTIQKIKVDGSPYKNLSKCSECKGEGFIYKKLNDKAGFSGKITSVMEISEGGFKSDRLTLVKISKTANEDLKLFVEKIVRYNALETYLSTFVDGIKKFTTDKGFLYPRFMQTVTSTGRLSSRNPNFQNQPRGSTFPIRKVISSRFDGGSIMEIDYAQLEFRTAVFLAQDKQGMKDIRNGVDVHQYTADIIGCSRQEAKPHTFKPLYGGMSGSEDEKRYYSAFLKKYPDIKAWHEKLQNEAIRTKVVTLPTGRQYAFPKVERMSWGGSSFSTQIKNYPVQGFATADIVPLACINIQELLEEHKTKSLLINTVHDSIVADVFPGEERVVASCLNNGCLGVIQRMKDMYGIDFNVPLDVELKVGSNWLDTKIYAS